MALRALSVLPLDPDLALQNLDKFNVSRVLFWLGLQRDPDLLPRVPGQKSRFSHLLVVLLDAAQLAGEIRPCDSAGAASGSCRRDWSGTSMGVQPGGLSPDHNGALPGCGVGALFAGPRMNAIASN